MLCLLSFPRVGAHWTKCPSMSVLPLVSCGWKENDIGLGHGHVLDLHTTILSFSSRIEIVVV
jgi:hypothetical protein